MHKTFRGRITDDDDATESLPFAARRKALPERCVSQSIAHQKLFVGQKGALQGMLAEISPMKTARNGQVMLNVVLDIGNEGGLRVLRKCFIFGVYANKIKKELSVGHQIAVGGTWRISLRNTANARWVLFVDEMRLVAEEHT